MSNQIKASLKLLGTREASQGLRDVGRAAEGAEENVGDLNDRLRDSRGRFTGAGRAARGAGREVRGAGRDAKFSSARFADLGASLAGMAKGATIAAAAMAGIGFAVVGKGAIQASAEMERFESQLSVLLKSSDKAKIRLEELFKIGSTTPFELGDLVKADQILTSFGADAGLMREGVMDLAGALGGELPDAAMAVAKSFGAGMGASDQLRESYALLFQDVKRRASELGDASDINNWRAALVDALRATDGVVKGGTALLAATFEGQLSNVADSWFKFKKQVGDAGLFDYAKLGIAELIEGMNSGTAAGQRFTDLLSSALIDALDGTARVMSVLAGAISSVAMGVAGLVTAFNGLLLVVAKVRLSFLEFEKSTDVFGELEGEGELAKKFAADLDQARQRVDDLTGSVNRSEQAMGAFFDATVKMGRVGGTLDEVREKFEKLQAVQANQRAMDPAKSFAQSRRDDFRKFLEDEGLREPDKPSTAAPTGKAKKSAAQEMFEDLEKQLAKLIPKETLSDVEKLDALLAQLAEGMRTTRASTSRNWEGLIASAERAREVAIKAEADEKAAKTAKEVEKLSEQMKKAGATARKAALQVSGQWRESDTLGEKIRETVAKMNEFTAEAERLGLSSTETKGTLDSMRENVKALTEARKKALEEERKIIEEESRKSQSFLEKTFGSGLKGFASQLGGLLSSVTQLGTGGLGGMLGAAGPVGAGIAGIAQLGQMGYTKTEEFVDPLTGETRTREVEVSAAEAIGEQMEGFLEGFITGIVEVLPELIGTVIPDFIADGIPALLEGLVQAFPRLVFALVVKLPAALAEGVAQWWRTVWESIKEFFRSIGDAGGGALAGAGIGAAIGSVVPGVGTLLGGAVGGLVGGLAGAFFHSGGYADRDYGLGTIDRTGPAILKQGERVVPPTGADTQTARQNGLAAFMPRGATVNIHTAAIDPDVVDRLGVMLDEHFGYGGRNTLPLFGG